MREESCKSPACRNWSVCKASLFATCTSIHEYLSLISSNHFLLLLLLLLLPLRHTIMCTEIRMDSMTVKFWGVTGVTKLRLGFFVSGNIFLYQSLFYFLVVIFDTVIVIIILLLLVYWYIIGIVLVVAISRICDNTSSLLTISFLVHIHFWYIYIHMDILVILLAHVHIKIQILLLLRWRLLLLLSYYRYHHYYYYIYHSAPFYCRFPNVSVQRGNA